MKHLIFIAAMLLSFVSFTQVVDYTKQEIITLATELKHQDPSTDATDLHTQRFTAQENAVIDQIMEVIQKHGLSADQAKTLLARTIQLLEWGKQAANMTPEANA